MSRRYRFDNIDIDVENSRVTVGSEYRPLEPESFRLLLLLIDNRSRVLPKDEIRKAVWPDSVASDNLLARSITQIRKALDDDPRAPKFIQTVPGFGYRFLGVWQDGQALPDGSATTPIDKPPENPPAAPAPKPIPPHQHPNRSYRLIAAAGGGLVVALLLGGRWLSGRKASSFREPHAVVLADFINSTGDPVFDGTLKQALAVQLGQSPTIDVLSDAKVRAALQDMGRSSDERLTATLARRVCEHTGSRAYIVGSIANPAPPYKITVDAAGCSSGVPRASEQGDAQDQTQVLPVLDGLAANVRKQLGEPLQSIAAHDAPLARAASSSLQALQAYASGLAKFGRGEHQGAVPLFQRATQLDPDFALAYAELGRAYDVLADEDRRDAALRKAFALRDRAEERAKLEISAAYYEFVTNQPGEAIQVCRTWAQAYPHDFAPHRILGLEYALLGRYEESAQEFQRAMELDPGQPQPYAGLMLDDLALNRLAEARAAYSEAKAHRVDLADAEHARYLLAFLEGDRQAMSSAAGSLVGRAAYEKASLLEQAFTDAYFGRRAHALELLRCAEEAALRDGQKTVAASVEAYGSMMEALFGNSAEATARATAALGFAGESTPASGADHWVRPYLALTVGGSPAVDAKIADRLARGGLADSVVSSVWLWEAQGLAEMQRGNPLRALDLLEPVKSAEAGRDDNFLAAYLRGSAYLASNHAAEAAPEFQGVIDHRGVVLNSPIGALARLGLARACVLKGDAPKAVAAYRDFLDLWKDADPGIPVLIAARSEYAKLN